MFGSERYGKRTPSEREQLVIELVAQGLKNKEVADAIGTTEHVIKNYLRSIYDKLGLGTGLNLPYGTKPADLKPQDKPDQSAEWHSGPPLTTKAQARALQRAASAHWD